MKIKKLFLPVLLTLGIALAVSELGSSILSYKNVLNPANLLNYNTNYATIQYLFAGSSDCPPNTTWHSGNAYCISNGVSFRGWEIVYFGASKYTNNVTINASDFDLGCSASYCDNSGYPYLRLFGANSPNTNSSFNWTYIGTAGPLDDKTYNVTTFNVAANLTHLIVGRDGGGDARPDPAVHWVTRN